MKALFYTHIIYLLLPVLMVFSPLGSFSQNNTTRNSNRISLQAQWVYPNWSEGNPQVMATVFQLMDQQTTNNIIGLIQPSTLALRPRSNALLKLEGFQGESSKVRISFFLPQLLESKNALVIDNGLVVSNALLGVNQSAGNFQSFNSIKSRLRRRFTDIHMDFVLLGGQENALELSFGGRLTFLSDRLRLLVTGEDFSGNKTATDEMNIQTNNQLVGLQIGGAYNHRGDWFAFGGSTTLVGYLNKVDQNMLEQTDATSGPGSLTGTLIQQKGDASIISVMSDSKAYAKVYLSPAIHFGVQYQLLLLNGVATSIDQIQLLGNRTQNGFKIFNQNLAPASASTLTQQQIGLFFELHF